MIVNHLDLDTAVSEEIISREQAVQLQALANRHSGPDSAYIDFVQDTRDEPFRLMRGFRDFFIAVGVVIFAIGLSSTALSLQGEHGFFRSFSFHEVTVSALLVGLGMWAFGLLQAEFITRKYRLPLSSLVVAIAFAIWSAYLFVLVVAWSSPFIPHDAAAMSRNANSIIAQAAFIGAILGTVFFYWRYRLPSALFLLAGSAVALSFVLAEEVLGDRWIAEHPRILIGAWGVVTFVVAMSFDIKDRLRVTRLSECAFWLHLFAAPMLVHAMLFSDPSDAPKFDFILGTMAVLSVIALVIDRRALLVSGLGYIAVAISQLVSSSAFFNGKEFAFTAFVLGAIVLTLGLGWTRLRRAALALLPFDAIKSRLPPAADNA